LNLGYPGGPVIDRLARDGNAQAIRFPRAYLEKDSLDFSFSGIKTAVLHYVRKHTPLPVADLAASFQQAVVDVLVAKTLDAARQCRVSRVVVSGGVAANSQLRREMQAACAAVGLQLVLPHPRLCTDNGAMIAAAAYWRLHQGQLSSMRRRAIAWRLAEVLIASFLPVGSWHRLERNGCWLANRSAQR
jgi:N6-L-threonylcarbamoyladenine synthase